MSNLVVAWAVVHRTRGWVERFFATKKQARVWIRSYNMACNAGRRGPWVWRVVRLEGRW